MHVAVTGASSGIGEAIAREFARAGASITVVARRRELLEKLAAEVTKAGGRCRIVVHDLSDCENAGAWIAGAVAELGPIDVLVNNAGIENSGPTPMSDPALGVKVLRTNLQTPLLIMREVMTGMIARRSGTIVNVASVAALAPPPMQAWYGASKAGLAAFSECLRIEIRRTGVRVVTVYPGPVKTAMGDAGYAAFGGRKGLVGMIPEGSPEALAKKVRRAVERRRARVIYPAFYGVTRLAPWFAMWVTGMVAPLPPQKT